VIFNTTVTVTDIPASPYFVNNFTVNSGTVTLNDNLDIRGNLSVASGAGFVGASGTTITFNGTVAQNIGGAGTTTFHKLVINNAGSSTTDIFGYTRTNPTNITGSITVNNNMEIRRGVVAFCTATSATFNHNIAGNLVLGSSTSEVTISTFSAISNTEFVINHATNSNVTLTVNGDFSVPSGQGGVTAVMTSPTAIGGSSIFTVKGNVDAVDTLIFSMNGRVNAFASGSPTNPITMNVGTADGSGNFIMSNYGNVFLANSSGTTVPTLNLLGGTSSSEAIFDVKFAAVDSNFLILGANGNGNTFINIDGVYRVAPGASLWASDRNAIRTKINGRLIVPDNAEICSVNDGIGSGSPILGFGPNGVLVVEDLQGLGDGTSTTPFAFCINRRTGQANFDLSQINTIGTIEYNGTGQTVTPRNTTLSNNYFNLAFSGSGGKTLGGDIDVGNSLALNGGVVSTGTNLLRVNSTLSGAITRTAGHINGRLQRTYPNSLLELRFFPVGDAATYRPISLLAGTGALVPLEVQLISSNANTLGGITSPLQLVSFARYYEVTNNSPTNNILISQVEDMQVSGDDGVANVSSIRVATRTTGNWSSQGGSISIVPSLITSTAFSESLTPSSKLFVALGSETTDNPLPVELLSFTATSTAQGVRLMWETASEHESRGFTLLRKKEGESAWTEVASYQTDNALRSLNALNGASYSFTDKTPLEVGKSYDYQLRETGFDGQVATLETVTLTVRFNVAREYELAQNYPNPFNPTTTIRYQIPTAETVSLKVYDVLGKEVATLVSGRQEAGNYAVPFNASGLSSGMYFYRLQAGSFVETRKMMLVK
jgi:hypothetical protein